MFSSRSYACGEVSVGTVRDSALAAQWCAGKRMLSNVLGQQKLFMVPAHQRALHEVRRIIPLPALLLYLQRCMRK